MAIVQGCGEQAASAEGEAVAAAALDFGLMIQGRRIVRIDVWAAWVRTTAGIAVGDPEDRIGKAYREPISTTPNFYDVEHGHYVEVAGQGLDTGYALLFETDGKKITGYRSGLPEAVRLVEGCS